MKIISSCLILLFLLTSCRPSSENKENQAGEKISGWNILSNNDSLALKVIERAGKYEINHLQLSHSIVMDLKDVKDPGVAERVNRLTRIAHEAGIEEVVIWDHSLYNLNYYPDRFKTGPGGKIDLDSPDFWDWIKHDLRLMLDKMPGINGIVLTFIETGAHVEDQYSQQMKTEEEKLSAMVDTLASVIIDERGLNLYIRTFIYTRAELGSLLRALNLVKNPEVKVMTKEVPHDFFLTHPVSEFVANIQSPVLIEFDAAHEYNGQGIIASIFPEVHVKRWQYYSKLPNVKGYVARTDRKNTSTIIGTPSEINLFALKKASTNDQFQNVDEIYDEFIKLNYGEAAIPWLKPAYKLTPDIILSSLYTLGLPLNSHSRLDIENDGAYQRHVSGKWMKDMYIHLNRGIDTSLHYWSDIVNHLAPKWYKGRESNQLSVESTWVLDSAWLEDKELMNETYLRLIISEKHYGVEKAVEALQMVKNAKPYATKAAFYDTTLHVFERTLLTARLHEALSGAYFGYRVFARGGEYQTDFVFNTVKESMDKLPQIIRQILDYPYPGPTGQYIWREDAIRAIRYYFEFRELEINGFKSVYTPSTFERFPYQGPSKAEETTLLNEFQLLFPS